MNDLVFLQEFFSFLLKVLTVVRNDLMRYPISVDNVELYELRHLFGIQNFERSCFHPLGEVIDGYQDVFMTIGCLRLNLSDDIYSPYCKWPRS